MAALSTWQEIALVASPIAAAVAAGASWASVWQARRLARESTSPFLLVQITSTPERTIGALITNAGGGMARGAIVLLAHPPYFVVGPLGHGGFLRPGATVQVLTDITIIEGVRTSVMASCRDTRRVSPTRGRQRRSTESSRRASGAARDTRTCETCSESSIPMWTSTSLEGARITVQQAPR